MRLAHPFACLLGLCAVLAAAPAAWAVPLPRDWPATLQLGVRDREGGAAALRERAPLGMRYHYLSGGVRTGRGWATWARGEGSFVDGFISDSAASGFMPVFSYYMVRESQPGAARSEAEGVIANLADADTMRALLQDLELFFTRAGRTRVTTVLHLEPDLWGYVQRHGDGSAGSVVARLAPAAGGVQRLPSTVAGFAQAVRRLRDRLAPNVLLGYHVSDWGTGQDLSHSDPGDSRVDQMASEASAFYRSLGTSFDLLFAEFDNRDSAWSQVVGGDANAWWTPEDFARHARFLAGMSSTLDRPVVLWQIPLGNQVKRELNNTAGRWRDNRVQWLLGSSGRSHLEAYRRAGVVALLFGHAFDDATTPDSDGGYFFSRARAYYAQGALRLPGGRVRRPGRARARSSAPRLRVGAVARPRSARRGRTVRIDVRVTSAETARALVAVQLYRPRGGRFAHQKAFPAQRLVRRTARRLTVRFRVPRRAARGEWQVKVGVFDPDWRRLWAWNDRAATFRVR